ncbi:MAG: hypothetical protein ACLUKN_13255 [Bacilli bacterium]
MMKKLTFLIMALVANTLIGAPMLAPDPNLLVEKLDNGLTIAVYRNAEPPKASFHEAAGDARLCF